MAEITDYFLAVYLLAMNEALTDVQVQPEEVFHFADSSSLPTHIAAYRADTALVNPKVFARKIMELRRQIKQRQDEAASA